MKNDELNPATGCKCTFAQRIVGDGCDMCNPEQPSGDMGDLLGLLRDTAIYSDKVTMPIKTYEGIKEYIRANTPAQYVDVEALKLMVHTAHLTKAYNGGITEGDKEDIEENLKQQRYAYQYGAEESVDWAIDYLHEQGYLSKSNADEKRVKELENRLEIDELGLDKIDQLTENLHETNWHLSEHKRVMALLVEALFEAMTLDDLSYDEDARLRGEKALAEYEKLGATK